MTNVYTTKLRKGRTFDHARAIDITVMTGGKGAGAMFAPTWALVCGIRAWRGERKFVGHYAPVTPDEYTSRYLALLRTRYLDDTDGYACRAAMHAVLECDCVLCCYCAPDEFCRRFIVAETVLPKIAARLHLPYTYAGELY